MPILSPFFATRAPERRRGVRTTLFTAAAALCLSGALRAAPAYATTRACSGNALANTTDVLCAPPGACTGDTVTVTGKITLTTDCAFDVGGRALVIEGTIDLRAAHDDPTLEFSDTRDITIGRHGKILARGRKRSDQSALVALETLGRIEHRGLIDVSAPFAGAVTFTSVGDVHLAHGSKIKGNSNAPLVDRERFGDGGILEVDVASGSFVVEGTIQLRGATGGSGGSIDALVARNLELRSHIDVSGGNGFEGSITADAGDDITVTGRIDARSRSNGDGGEISLEAGTDEVGDVTVGGRAEVRSAIIDIRGGASDNFGGFGGDLDLLASGPITVAEDVVIRADAAADGDGRGGLVDIDSADGFNTNEVIGPTDGDAAVAGAISARGGSRHGLGGDVFIVAGRSLVLTASVDASGSDGGSVYLDAGEDATIAAPIAAVATDPSGIAGAFRARAGVFSGATTGRLTVAGDVVTRGGPSGAPRILDFVGCELTVDDHVVIDGRGAAVAGTGGSDVLLASVAPMQLGAGSRYLADPDGSITTQHPPGADPVIGAGVVFDPTRLDDPTAFSLPGCP